MNKKLNFVVLLVLGLFFCMGIANAATTFTVDTSNTGNIIDFGEREVNSAINEDIVITSSLDNLNLTITKEDLKNSAGNILTITLSDNNVNNLSNAATKTLTFTSNTKTIVGDFSGKIIITDSNNASNKEEIIVKVNVINENANGGIVIGGDTENPNTPTTISIDATTEEDVSKTLSYTNKKNYDFTAKFTETIILKNSENTDSVEMKFENAGSLFVPKATTKSIGFDIATQNSALSSGTYTGLLTIHDDINNIDEEYTIKLNLINKKDLNIGLTSTKIKLNSDNEEYFYIEGKADKRKTFTLYIKNTGIVDLTGLNLEMVGDLCNDDSGRCIDEDEIDFDDFSSAIDVNKKDSGTIEVNFPDDDIGIEIYQGTLKITSTNGLEKEYPFFVNVTDGDKEVEIQNYEADVGNDRILILEAEEGKTFKNIDFVVKNTGTVNFNDIGVRIAEDFEGDNGETMNKNIADFDLSDNIIDSLEVDDEEEVTMTLAIPSNQKSGTYTTELEIYHGTDILDTVEIEVEVVGDIYIKSIIFPEKVNPEDEFKIDVTIKNKESTKYDDVYIKVILDDADFGGGDISKTSRDFILDGRDERLESFTFSLPEDIEDGTHKFEVIVRYNDEEISRNDDFVVERKATQLKIKSARMNPTTVKCGTQSYSYITVKNIGSKDKIISVSAEVEGTDIKLTGSKFTLDSVDEITKTFKLDTSKLEAGNYNLIQKVLYDGLYQKEEIGFVVSCGDDSKTTIEIKDTSGNQTIEREIKNQKGMIDVFGYKMQNTTLYLLIAFLVLLVMIAIFAVYANKK